MKGVKKAANAVASNAVVFQISIAVVAANGAARAQCVQVPNEAVLMQFKLAYPNKCATVNPDIGKAIRYWHQRQRLQTQSSGPPGVLLAPNPNANPSATNRVTAK